MIWFFRISKAVLVIFIISCLLRLTFVFMMDSGLIGMVPEIKREGSMDANKNKSLVKNSSDNGSENQKYTKNRDSDDKTSKNDKKSEVSEEYFLTSKEVGLINNISLKDKILGLSILCKIKKQDFNRLLSIINGGITFEEYEDLEQIFKRNLSQKDIDSLNAMLLKNKKLYAEGKIKK